MGDRWSSRFRDDEAEEDFGGTGTEHRTRSNPNYTRNRNAGYDPNSRHQRTNFDPDGTGFSGGGGNFGGGNSNNNSNSRSSGGGSGKFESFLEFLIGLNGGAKASDFHTRPVLFSNLKDEYAEKEVTKKRKNESSEPIVEEVESESDEEPKYTAPATDDLPDFQSLFSNDTDKPEAPQDVLVEVTASDPNYQLKMREIEKEKKKCFFCAYDLSEGLGKEVYDYFDDLIWNKSMSIKKASTLTAKYYREHVMNPQRQRGVVMPNWTSDRIQKHFSGHTKDAKMFLARSIEMWDSAQRIASEHLFTRKVNPRTGESFLQADKTNLELMKAAETALERKYGMKESIMNFSGARDNFDTSRLK